MPEPLGGAHRYYDTMAQNLKSTTLRELATIKADSNNSYDDLLNNRFNLLMSYGYC